MNPPLTQEMQDMWVPSLVWEYPLKDNMATHSSVLAWRISTDRGAWWAKPIGSQRIGHTGSD